MLALSISAVLAAPASGALFISQYVEGSGFNKTIELANSGESEISLDGYRLAKSVNGDGSWGKPLSLSGLTIPAHDVLVIVNPGADSALLNLGDLTNTSVVDFNGNDPVAILTPDGAVVDVIGNMGGSDWGKDVTLVRNVFTPSGEYDSAQWSVKAKDSLEGLGELGDEPSPVTFACSVDGSDPVFTAIPAIQGEGDRSPYLKDGEYITADSYFVKGIVSAVTSGLTKGFYLQSESDDGNPLTSEGLFVYTGQTQQGVTPGDEVCVKGQIQEYYQLTQLKAGAQQWVKLSQRSAPQATPIVPLPSDSSFAQTLERYEGMLVSTTPELNMRVTRTFGYDYDARRNNMVLAQGRINMHPNQKHPAGSEQAKQQSQENAQHRLFVESDAKAPDGVIPYYPDFGRTDVDQNGSTEDYLRVDDTLNGLEGALSYSYGEYRLIVTNTISNDNIVHNDPRTDKPKMYEGDLRIASFNVLNYFYSPFGGDLNRFGSNRGANNLAEFERQQAKIVNAILRLVPDKSGQYHYVAIDSNGDGVTDEMDSVGTDAITTGVIYRGNAVQLEQSRVIPMPSQQAPEVTDETGKVIEDGKNYQRDTLAPTFKVLGGKEKITVAVNHFKSKGSACWEDVAPVSEGGQGGSDTDQQGSCENFRVAAATALGEALAKIKGHKVILGDLNSYGMEDPLLVLTDYSQDKYGKIIRAARNTYIDGQPQYGDEGAVITQGYGYLNAVSLRHPDSWSYSYNDEVGALDHLLVSPGLKDKVVDATDWHINGGESTLFDYNQEYKGDLPHYNDHFRASDHDPAVLELNIYGGSLGSAAIAGLGLLALWRRRQ